MEKPRPVLVYDGECGFCRRWVERWRDMTGERVEYAPYQEAAARFQDIPLAEFEKAVWLFEPDGKTSRAAEAVFRSLSLASCHRWMLWAYANVPGFKTISESFYALVAKNRTLFSRLSRFFWGDDVKQPSYFISSSVFLRTVGFVYFIAFASLAVQVLGLIGSDGILPVKNFVEAASHQLGNERFWQAPTLVWLNASDAFLQGLCWAGAVCGALVAFGILPSFLLLVCWTLYLSLVSVGGPFLMFQWDTLLLETGFLAIFLAPPCGRLRFLCRDFQGGAARFLLKILAFKLMFFSGVVKLASHDPVWKNLTALKYHYETQPLPPWTAWYAHHLPEAFQKTSCFLVFATELGLPFFLFFPRRLRHLAASGLMFFQLLIMLTGNYTFFNILTVALCLIFLDDSAWPPFLKARLEKLELRRSRRWPRGILATVAVLVVGLTLGMFRWLEPFRLVNNYGLFAVMTTERPEIIVEGSSDGETWLPYEFKYKPGDVDRRPAFVQPYQPRLDWQMWFAALGGWRRNLWFMRFCNKLLEGSPAVTGLLEKNPFPETPPRYVRARLFKYHFTDEAEKKKTGAWWRREEIGLYCPVVSRS